MSDAQGPDNYWPNPWYEGATPRHPKGDESNHRGGRPMSEPVKAADALVRAAGIVLTRGQLLETVWGSDFVGDDHVLDVHVGNLRRKLGDDSATPRFVETVRGIGFRLVTI